MIKFAEIIQQIQHSIHLVKPLLFEAVLFVWAVIEMGKFIWTIALGGHGA